MVYTNLPLGSVCLDHLGVHLMTVEAQWGGKCSSNMHRYQYLFMFSQCYGKKTV